MTGMTFKRFWIPQFAYQVREWLINKFPEDKGRYRKMTAGGLFKVYNEVRKKEG